MRNQELADRFGWYIHLMTLAQGDVTRLDHVVEMNHKEAFTALSYLYSVKKR